ncbi:iron-siderophore ABC transporter substrate-binding protein [Leucothrix sargassi]|nr:iron-siderophore ABC transporter substrate-binding protein [Leucothrix sargassi]
MKRQLLLAPFLLFCLLTQQALANEFPVSFEHKYGTTTLTEKPEKVVSLSFNNHDNFLALGVTPVAVRHWFGNFKYGMWPWAEAKLGEQKPVVLKGEINIEQLAALKPDVIEAMWSGITEEQYKLLSRIAPVVATLKGHRDYGMPWALMAETTGKIVGQQARANELISAINTRTAKISKAHPTWQGASVVVAYYWSSTPGAYTSNDVRPQFLSELGFVTPKVIDEGGDKSGFLSPVSIEDLSPLESDVLIWTGATENVDPIRNLALRGSLKAHTEGREVYADPMLTSAFSHFSLLSLPYVLDTLVPMIQAAMDGDPATPVSSSVKAKLAPE